MDENAKKKRRDWLHSLREGDSARLVDHGGRQIGIGRVMLINTLVDIVEIEYPASGGNVPFSRNIGMALEKHNFDRLEEPGSQTMVDPRMAHALT